MTIFSMNIHSKKQLSNSMPASRNILLTIFALAFVLPSDSAFLWFGSLFSTDSSGFGSRLGGHWRPSPLIPFWVPSRPWDPQVASQTCLLVMNFRIDGPDLFFSLYVCFYWICSKIMLFGNVFTIGIKFLMKKCLGNMYLLRMWFFSFDVVLCFLHFGGFLPLGVLSGPGKLNLEKNWPSLIKNPNSFELFEADFLIFMIYVLTTRRAIYSETTVTRPIGLTTWKGIS